jgi:hypothetical protein
MLAAATDAFLSNHRDCFAREVPVTEAITIEGQDLRANKCALNNKLQQAEHVVIDHRANARVANRLSYGLTLHRFVIEFLKGQQGGDEGFTFFGFGLSLTLSPERLITYIIKGTDEPVRARIGLPL